MDITTSDARFQGPIKAPSLMAWKPLKLLSVPCRMSPERFGPWTRDGHVRAEEV